MVYTGDMRPSSESLCLTLSSRFLQAFFSETGTDLPTQQRLMEQVGIAADTLTSSTGRVTEDQFATLYRLMASARNDELLGLLSRPMPGGTMKFGGYSIIAAPTTGIALHRYSRLLKMLSDDFEVLISRNDGLASIALREPDGPRRCRPMGLELTLKVFHGVGSWLIGRNIPLMAVNFSFPAPTYLDDLYSLFPGPLNFDCPMTTMTFDASLLDLQFHRTERDLRTFLSRQPRDWLCSPSVRQPVAHQVRTCLLEGGVGSMKVPDIAKTLNMSLRTLCRRLEQEGMSVKEVKDALRRDLAIHRLTQTEDPISEIAEGLGFGDIPSFYRAFRSWTGVAPGAYRRDTGIRHVDS